MGKIATLSIPYGLRKRIEKNIGMNQFVINANQVLDFERRMIASHVFSDFHAMKGLEQPFFAWDDSVVEEYEKIDHSLAMFSKLSHRILGLSPLKVPASDEWIQNCYGDDYRRLFDIIGFSPESIVELIYQTESSSAFMQTIESHVLGRDFLPKKDILKKIMPYTRMASLEPTMDNAMFILENVVNSAACLYFYEDAIRFVVDTGCKSSNEVLSWIPDCIKEHYDIQDLFQYQEDVMVDFRLNDGLFSAYTVRLESLADHVAIYNHNGKLLAETDKAKVLSVYSVQDNHNFTNFTQIVLVEDCLSPGNERVFVMQQTTDMNCEFGCKLINRCTMVRTDKRGSLPVEVCSLKRSKIEKDRCICNLVLPFNVLSLCAYVLDCYYHRNTIGKKQELRDSFYTSIPVYSHLKSYEREDSDATYHIMPLHEYYELEKNNLQSGQTHVAERTRKKVGEFKEMISMFQVAPSTNNLHNKHRL